jgi:Holliday junction resolvase-like predicted endonuclease
MERSSKRYLEFEKLVADIFRAEGFDVAENYRLKYGNTIYEVDLLLTSKTQATAVVEVKLFRTLFLPTGTLFQAAARIEHMRQRLQRDRAVFVTSARILRSSSLACRNLAGESCGTCRAVHCRSMAAFRAGRNLRQENVGAWLVDAWKSLGSIEYMPFCGISLCSVIVLAVGWLRTTNSRISDSGTIRRNSSAQV